MSVELCVLRQERDERLLACQALFSATPPAKTISAHWSTGSEQATNEQARTTSVPLLGNIGGITMMEDRYYVQRLTEQVFLIRERMSVDGEPGPDDRIVRSFDVGHDAYRYADSVNDRQRKLDEHDGHWAQRAI
jgi:hypothetical protein